jgi:hypothetical protein
MGALAEPLDQPRFALAGLEPLEAHQEPVAKAWRTGGFFGPVGRETDRGRIRIALGRADIEVAVGVALDDIDHGHRRRRSRLAAPATHAAARKTLPLESGSCHALP